MMVGMANLGVTPSSTDSHCWVCDDSGGLYIFRNINVHSRNRVSADLKCGWTNVDRGFRSVYAGYSGLVCGIKNSTLYIRKGVTSDNPIGTEWAQHECDILKIMLGKVCIVRKSSRGNMYVAQIGSTTTEMLDWKSILPLDDGEREDQSVGEVDYHHVVDDEDRLFSITGGGEVYCCELRSGELLWSLISGPPPHLAKSAGFVGWVSSFWTTQRDDWISTVSFGVSSLWCLRKDCNEIWQLVTSWLNRTPKVNWVKTELPLSGEEKIISLSACKCTKDGLYLIVEDEGHYRMVFCSLSSRCDMAEIGLPTRYPCRSMAICSIPVIRRVASAQSKVRDIV